MTTTVSLQTHVIEGRLAGPHLLITAGVHGDEFEGMIAVQRLKSFLDQSPIRGQLTLVPIANEPAYALGKRTAEDGLDLARQCPGQSIGSFTVRLAHALSELIRTADYYVDLHSGGIAMRVAPLVGYMLHSDAEVLESQRRMAMAFNMPLVWGTSAELQGRTLSVARDANIPAIYAEYNGSGACHDEGCQDYFQGCLNVMTELGMVQLAPPPNRVERIVEDARPASGHLQICHQSPITGVFSPTVELMQHVSVGDRLGLVLDPQGMSEYEIHTQQGGIVISLASFARVRQGDGLAVVMETDAAGVTCRRR